jgi:hypothetical protein
VTVRRSRPDLGAAPRRPPHQDRQIRHSILEILPFDLGGSATRSWQIRHTSSVSSPFLVPAHAIPRHLTPLVDEALADTRVVGVVGPRQAGKSTLVKEVVARTDGASYVSLDDLDTRTAAAADPRSFVENRPGMLAIDEVQRVPSPNAPCTAISNYSRPCS